MKFLFSLLATISLSASTPIWQTDFSKAKQLAHQSDKLVLVNFSGSDWCIPCIRLHKNIFESATFQQFADTSLVLVKADFPRLRKNQLSEEQTKLNEALADKYDPQGHFPLTVLLNSDGKVLKQWDGLPNLTPEQFISEINGVLHAGK